MAENQPRNTGKRSAVRESTAVQISELELPEILDGPQGEGFRAAVEIVRQERILTWGNDDLAYTAEEVLVMARDPYEQHVHLVAKLDGEVRGQSEIILPLEDNQHLAWVWLATDPKARGEGIGKALLLASEEYIRTQGRNTVVVETSHPADTVTQAGAATLKPASGVGELPVSSREVRFAQNGGYALEQIERFSGCDLPVEPGLLARQLAAAEASAASTYRLHGWTDHCPAEWVEDLAWLHSRMSTDAPHAGVDLDEEPWDAERVREGEAIALAQGRITLVTAVEHLATGSLVGFTVITVLGHRSDVVFQDDTLVLGEHRGHKLGLWLKVTNLARIAEEHPQSRRIYTWNAEENEHMLAVNVALGFVSTGFTGQWQKVLV